MERKRRDNPELRLQKDIVTVLCSLGYTVMETGKSRGRVRCSSCGSSSYATGWQGNTPGLPDLYAHRKGIAMPVAVALELKAPKGKPTEAQQNLADQNMTRIVRSVSDALKAVLELETALGNARQSERIMQVMNDFWSNTIV
jgi:hypothetical protein